MMPATPPFNILFIFPLPLIPEKGGVERVSDLLARELSRRGHRVFYLHRPAKGKNSNAYENYTPPASVHYLPKRRLKSRENITFYHRFLKEHNIHFIINQMGLSNNYCPFTRVPKNAQGFPQSISVLHNPPLMGYEYMGIAEAPGNDRERPSFSSILTRKFITPLRRWNYKRKRIAELRDVARSSDCMCVLSQAFCSQIRELRVLNGSKCMLRCITNPCAFQPVAEMPPKQKQLLYVSRLDSGQKVPQRLIPIWQQLAGQHPDWELIIIGDGPCRAEMEKEMASLPRVRFEGFRPPAPYFRDAALSCLTSTYEGFGLVLVEAMCHGTVPVAYNSFPVLSELLEGHMDKLAATPFEPDDFAAKLSWLMSHDEERQALALDCIDKSRQYTTEAITDKWEALLGYMADVLVRFSPED